MKVVRNEFMSSEESDSDDDSVIIHQLPWRTAYVTKMFAVIDKYNSSKKSPQAHRQMKPRKVGIHSTRSCPIDYPDWAVTACSTDSV